MSSISDNPALANLPAEELMTSLTEFLAPVLVRLPEARLRQVSVLAVRGVLAGQSPVLTEMARGGQPADKTNWALAKRFYRFVANERFDQRTLLKGLYGIAQRAVSRYPRPHLVVAPRQFRKALHGGLGGCLDGAEEYASRSQG